jgi:hypothetical protein
MGYLGMELKKAHFWKGILLLLITFLLIFAQFPEAVEKYYSSGFYPFFGKYLRLLTIWCPVSIGDMLYLVAIFYIIFISIKILYIGCRFRRWPTLKKFLFATFLWLVIGYAFFKLCWGLNYNRRDIGYSMGITAVPYTIPELKLLNAQLIQRLNEARKKIPGDSLPTVSWEEQKQLAIDAYTTLAIKNSRFTYAYPSIKKCSWNFWGDWIGFTGYYNPFSGEAQVKADLPGILQPYITCHEIGHQIGFAREREASFVGFLAASASQDIRLKYSLYLDIFSLVQQELWRQYAAVGDSSGLRIQLDSNRKQLDTLVKLDRRAIRRYFQQRSHQITPAFTQVYTQYLKANGQPAGMLSYNEVLGWILGYQKKYGDNSW